VVVGHAHGVHPGHPIAIGGPVKTILIIIVVVLVILFLLGKFRPGRH
jgi:hypothetical protein